METHFPGTPQRTGAPPGIHSYRLPGARGANIALVAACSLYVVNNTSFPWLSTFIMLLTTAVIAAGLRRPAWFMEHLRIPTVRLSVARRFWFVPVWFRVGRGQGVMLHLPWELTISVVIATMIGLFAFATVKAAPLLVQQAYDIALAMPSTWAKIRSSLTDTLPEPIAVWLTANMKNWLPEFTDYLRGAASHLSSVAGTALSLSLGTVGESFGVLLFAFLIARKEGTIAGLIMPLAPAAKRNSIARLTNSTMRAIGECVCAQLVAGAVWAMGFTALLWVTGADYWFPVGLSALILESLIPWGGGFAAVLWAVLIEGARGHWELAGLMVVGYVTLLILQRRLVYRVLMDHVEHLDAIKSLGSLIIMFKLLGVIGFLLAIPCTIIVRNFLRFIHPETGNDDEPTEGNLAAWAIGRNYALITALSVYILNNTAFPWMTVFMIAVTIMVLTAFLRRPAAWFANLPIPTQFALGQTRHLFGMPVIPGLHVTRWHYVHVPRDVTIGLMLIGFVAMSIYAGMSIVPLVKDQAMGIADRLPGSWSVIRDGLQNNLPEPVATLAASNMDLWLPELTKYLKGAAEYLASFSGSLLSLSLVTLGEASLIIVGSFFFARKEGSISALVCAILPRRKRAGVKELIDRSIYEIGECVCAQLVSGAVFAIAFMGFLYVARGDYWFTVGLSSLILESIMPWVGGIVAVFAAIFIEASHLNLAGVLTVLAGYAVLCFVQWHIVYPLLMSRMSQLDTLKSLGSLYIGFKALGLMGSLLAIPLAVLFRNVLEYMHPSEPDLPGTDVTTGSEEDGATDDIPAEVVPLTAAGLDIQVPLGEDELREIAASFAELSPDGAAELTATPAPVATAQD